MPEEPVPEPVVPPAHSFYGQGVWNEEQADEEEDANWTSFAEILRKRRQDREAAAAATASDPPAGAEEAIAETNNMLLIPPLPPLQKPSLQLSASYKGPPPEAPQWMQTASKAASLAASGADHAVSKAGSLAASGADPAASGAGSSRNPPVRRWGQSGDGQPGDGQPMERQRPPVLVLQTPQAKAGMPIPPSLPPPLLPVGSMVKLAMLPRIYDQMWATAFRNLQETIVQNAPEWSWKFYALQVKPNEPAEVVAVQALCQKDSGENKSLGMFLCFRNQFCNKTGGTCTCEVMQNEGTMSES